MLFFSPSNTIDTLRSQLIRDRRYSAFVQTYATLYSIIVITSNISDNYYKNVYRA